MSMDVSSRSGSVASTVTGRIYGWLPQSAYDSNNVTVLNVVVD